MVEALTVQVEEQASRTESWQPVLEGELAQRAWEAIRAIAAEIPPPDLEQPIPPDAWGLASGSAGTALFYAYLAEATGEEAFEDRAVSDLEAALDCAAAQPFLLGLWQGVLGVTWSFDHLAGRLFESDDDAAASEVADDEAAAQDKASDEAGHEASDEEAGDADALLSRHLEGQQEVYDLIMGLAGYGVACLEGLPRASARRGLDSVLDHLLASVEPLDPGLAWFTPPHLLPDWQRQLAPDGYYNLGVAHGIPAVVVLLARCIKAGIRTAELMPVLEGTVDWIVAQRGDEGFPSWIAKGRERQTAARLAWCYGDPGLAAALAVAGRAVGQESWFEIAIDVACQAAGRDPARSGIQDTGICHGAAGLAHIFNRLWQASGREELAEASRYWFGEVLKMRRPDAGIGGFQAWATPRDKGMDATELEWVDEAGLLTGSAGIGLCLLAAVTGQEPAWDCSLTLSAPPNAV